MLSLQSCPNKFTPGGVIRLALIGLAALLLVTGLLIRRQPAVEARAPQANQAVPVIGPFARAAATGADDLTTLSLCVPDGGEVRFINTMRNIGGVAGAFVITAPIIPTGLSVRASIDSGQTFSSLNGGGTLVTPTAVTPGEERNLDVRVTVPAGLPAGASYDLVIQVASAANPSATDRTTDRLNSLLGQLTLVKAVTDLNGGSVFPGDTLEYSLTLSNPSCRAVNRTFIAEFIPINTTYLPNSVRIASGANAGPKTDAQGDDQVNYFPTAGANGQINVHTGTGATATGGGALAPGESALVTFQVRVNSNVASGVQINNAAQWGGDDRYPGGNSNIAVVTVSGELPTPLVGPFGQPAAVGPTNNNDDFTRVLGNFGSSNGLTTNPGAVRFINTLTNNGSITGNFVISAASIPTGFTVLASIDSGQTFASLNLGGTVTTPTPVNPGEQRNIDIRITAPAGLTIDQNYDVVIQVTSATDPGRFNRTIDRIRPYAGPLPSLALEKSVRDLNGGCAQAGDLLEYVLLLRNTGSQPVGKTFIAEFIPANVTYQPNSVQITAGANAGAKTDQLYDDQVDYFGPVSGDNGQINIFTGVGAAAGTGGTLAPGESATVVFRVRVNSGVPANTEITNGANWGAEDIYPGGNSNLVTVTVLTICPTVDLSISKTHTGNFNRGAVGSFTIGVNNGGTAASNGEVRITDILPASLTPISASGSGWSCALNGQTVTCTRNDSLGAVGGYPTITLTVNTSASAPDTVSNTATVSGGGDANAANNSATDVVTIVAAPTPDLTIAKTHTGNFVQCDAGTFSITVRNVGTGTTTGAVTVTDTLPLRLTPVAAIGAGWNCGVANQTVTCSRSDSLAAGAIYPPITLTVNTSASTPASLSNTVTVAGGGESNNANNSATDTVTVLTGGASPLVGPFGQPAAVGPTNNNDDFTRVLGNFGSSNGLTTNPGAVRFINTLTNTSCIEGNFVISAASIPTGFTVLASIDSGQTFASLNLGGTVTTPTPVNPGEQRNIDIRITAPAGLTIDQNYDVVIQVTSATDPGRFNRTIDRIRPYAGPLPSLALEKSVRDLNGGCAQAGDLLEYVLLLRNTGSQPVGKTFIAEFIPANVTYQPNSVQITAGANAGAKTDQLYDDQVDYFGPVSGDNGQINIFTGVGAAAGTGGTLAPGESATVVFRVRVNSGVPANTEITNGANWGAEDIYPGGNSNLAKVTIIAPCAPQVPDLTISKTHTENFRRGDTGDFTITVSNLTAGSTSGAITVTDTAPSGLVPASATGAGWSCMVQGQTVTCSRNDVLGANASYPPITIRVNVSPNADETLVNTAVVSGGGETNTANNTATDTVTIVANPACGITICFRSAAYYSLNFNNANHPRGVLLINGASKSSTDSEVKQALDGQLGSLTREFTAFQLSLLRASGVGAVNVNSALMSSVGCYGLFFSPVTLGSSCSFGTVASGNCTLTQQNRLGELRLQAIAVTSNGQLRNGRDGCILNKLFQQLNGSSSANVCYRPTGIVDFTSCN